VTENHEPASPQPKSPAQAVVEQPEGRILDPIDRYSEILFGLFMVLTFTGTLSVASAGKEDIRTMLIAAIGCNTAWGFVDGVMYVLRGLVARSRQAILGRAVRAATRPEDGQRRIADELGPLAASLDAPELERIRQWMVARPEQGVEAVRLTARDFRGALGVFLLVFASTFPVVLPFVFIADLRLAMRVSGAIAIVIMFRCGYAWGRYAGLVAWRSGLVMVLLGVAVEAVIIALGG
jgi:hypothetical protein